MTIIVLSGFQSPSVVVSYTTDPELSNAKKMLAQGLQIAAGVPLQCDEGEDFRSFRVGLFGLDKLGNVERTVRSLEQALGLSMVLAPGTTPQREAERAA